MERYRDIDPPSFMDIFMMDSDWWRESGLALEHFVPLFLWGVMFYLIIRFFIWFFTLPPISQEDLERHRKNKKDD